MPPRSKTDAAVDVLRDAARLIADSPGLVKGHYSLTTADGRCFCLTGAIQLARANNLYPYDVEYLATAELARTIHASNPEMLHLTTGLHVFGAGCVLVFNDMTLLATHPNGHIEPAAKAKAIELLNQTIDRLTKES